MRGFLALFATASAFEAFSALPDAVCEILEDPRTIAAVSLICQEQSKVPKEECNLALSKIWGAVLEKGCPKAQASIDALPDAACDILKDQDKEKEAVALICEKQSKVPADECEAGLSKIWELVRDKECAAKAVAALPEVACDILKDQDKEKAAVALICSKQTKVPADECEAGLSKVWETVAEKECPKTLAAFLPEAGCDILKDKSLEKRTVAAICEKQHKVPTLECKIGLSHFWETEVKKRCPKTVTALPPVAALPEVACDILKDQDKEKAAVALICSKQSKVPADECEAGLSKIWETVRDQECSSAKALPEVACDILKDQDKEKEAVALICSKQTKVPADECEAGLSKIWEMVAEEECPNAKALPEVACDILKDQDKEKEAVALICSKQTKVPADECEAGLSKIWEMVRDQECAAKAVADLPEVACDILKDQDQEKATVVMICSKQTKVPADECKAGLSKIWEMVAEKECPNAEPVQTLFV